jgi:hypothetical protein
LALVCLLLNGAVVLSPEPRYFLHVLPLALALAAAAPAALARLSATGAERSVRAALTVALLLLLTWDQEVGAADSAILERRGGRPFSELRTAGFESWTGALRSLPPQEGSSATTTWRVFWRLQPDYRWLRSDAEVGVRDGLGPARTSIYIRRDPRGPRVIIYPRGRRGGDVWVVLLDTTKYGFVDLASSVDLTR